MPSERDRLREPRRLSSSVHERPVTVEEFHRMGELGVFTEDDRVELLDGEIFEMTPIGGPHAACVIRLTEMLVPLLQGKAHVSVQNPDTLSDRSEPLPDIVVFRRADLSGGWLPTHEDTLLVIEVADTSLRYDRNKKVPIYARAGIPEVWVIDLNGERIHVYREPSESGYRTASAARRGETLAVAAVPSATMSVDEVLG